MIGTSASEPLRDYADKVGFNVGVAIKESYITSNNATHNNLVKKEFNTIVCENAMKAQNVAPSKNSYDFTIPDQVVNFALANNMKIRGHTLVWYNQNPDWLASGTRQTLLQNMKYHIEKVMSHYKGKLFQWDVVNEAFADNGGEYRPENPYYQIIGEDYIDSAFVYAHNVDPDCKLFINDYNNSYINDKSTALYNKVKRMVDAGIPVNGVGFQCHERSAKKAPDLYKKIRDNFDRFAALGLEIAITEIDIRLWDSTLAVQGEVYATFMKVALDMPECNTFVVWGVRDQDSWVGADQYALLFDNASGIIREKIYSRIFKNYFFWFIFITIKITFTTSGLIFSYRCNTNPVCSFVYFNLIVFRVSFYLIWKRNVINSIEYFLNSITICVK
jgi:endo-1,4-beta-xylanase